MPRDVGVAVIGTGFIGAVHARSARLAGGRLVGVVASTPARSAEAAAALGAEHGFESAEAALDDDAVDAGAHLHPESPARAARRSRARAWEACDLREAARDGRGAGAGPRGHGRRKRPGRRRAVRVPVLPDGARGARARARRTNRAGAADPRDLPAGLAPASGGRQLARRRGARRRIARVRGHRLALVRPRRVRLRAAHHARVRAVPDRHGRTRARRGTRRVLAGRGVGARPVPSAPRTRPWCSSRPMAGRSARR